MNPTTQAEPMNKAIHGALPNRKSTDSLTHTALRWGAS
jgi:hypothetical protein